MAIAPQTHFSCTGASVEAAAAAAVKMCPSIVRIADFVSI